MDMNNYVLNGKIVEMTEEEISQLQIEQKKFEAKEKNRPFSYDEETTMFIKKHINKASYTR